MKTNDSWTPLVCSCISGFTLWKASLRDFLSSPGRHHLQYITILYYAYKHTCKLKKIRLLSREFFSSYISNGPKYHDWSQETSCTTKGVMRIQLLVTHSFSVRPIYMLTLSQYNSFISWELCLDWLRREVLSALPKVPLWAAKSTEPPEISPVTPCSFGKSVLHTGELLSSVDKSQTDRKSHQAIQGNSWHS